MTRPDLVVFDCDGVLVDSERLTVAVESRVLAEVGWPMTPEEVVDRWMGKSSATQLADLTARLGPDATTRFDELTTRELQDAFERELTAVEGVEQLIDALHDAGVPTCVASSGTHDRMRRTLGVTGLRGRFEGRIFSATEVSHGKPAPDLFLHAARSMGAEPSRCVVVEDSAYGAQAGVAAGMTVYGFAGGLAPRETLARAGARLFERMTDLVPLLSTDRPEPPGTGGPPG